MFISASKRKGRSRMIMKKLMRQRDSDSRCSAGPLLTANTVSEEQWETAFTERFSCLSLVLPATEGNMNIQIPTGAWFKSEQWRAAGLFVSSADTRVNKPEQRFILWESSEPLCRCGRQVNCRWSETARDPCGFCFFLFLMISKLRCVCQRRRDSVSASLQPWAE